MTIHGVYRGFPRSGEGFLTLFGRIPILSTVSGAVRVTVGVGKTLFGLVGGIGSLIGMIPTGIGKLAGNEKCSKAFDATASFGRRRASQLGKGVYWIGRGAVEAVPVAGNLAVWGFDKVRRKVQRLFDQRVLNRVDIEGKPLGQSSPPL